MYKTEFIIPTPSSNLLLPVFTNLSEWQLHSSNSSGPKPWRYPNSSLSLSSHVQPREDPISFTFKISPETDTDHHLLLSSWSRPSCHAYFCPCSLSIYFHTEVKMISCETLQRPPSSFQGKVMCSTGSQPGPVTSQLLPPISLLTWLLCVKHASLRASSLLSLLLGPLFLQMSAELASSPHLLQASI